MRDLPVEQQDAVLALHLGVAVQLEAAPVERTDGAPHGGTDVAIVFVPHGHRIHVELDAGPHQAALDGLGFPGHPKAAQPRSNVAKPFQLAVAHKGDLDKWRNLGLKLDEPLEERKKEVKKVQETQPLSCKEVAEKRRLYGR